MIFEDLVKVIIYKFEIRDGNIGQLFHFLWAIDEVKA